MLDGGMIDVTQSLTDYLAIPVITTTRVLPIRVTLSRTVIREAIFTATSTVIPPLSLTS